MFLAESSKQREETDMLLTHYNFTQSNTALADQVCLQLLSSDSVTPWHTKTDVRITGKLNLIFGTNVIDINILNIILSDMDLRSNCDFIVIPGILILWIQVSNLFKK